LIMKKFRLNILGIVIIIFSYMNVRAFMNVRIRQVGF
jgi:hypothetical protein